MRKLTRHARRRSPVQTTLENKGVLSGSEDGTLLARLVCGPAFRGGEGIVKADIAGVVVWW
ncbi:hypothetical protein Trco_006943 [Trichoderma cornu-damae]|uniref:Uncharacterized protein n=1 Tax=Trichoderma cornu-damae TaxID=654480 RepID=A0A9P8QHL0_9HYPO|nr:hypothetical protein Trco_006943 [Trichoderma cornu-damae]